MSSSSAETTISSAVWRDRRLVVVMMVIGFLIGLIFGFVARSYSPIVAEASFLVSEAGTTTVFGVNDPADQERVVTDHIAILQSPAVLEAAAAGLGEVTGETLSVDEFEKRLSIRWSADSNVATAAFRGDSAEEAIGGANALLEAYQALLEEQTTANSRAAITLIDDAIAEQQATIDGLQQELLDQGELDALTSQLPGLTTRAAQIVEQLGVTNSETARQTLEAELDSITRQIEMIGLTADVTPSQAVDPALQRTLENAIDEQATLISRRNELAVEAEVNKAPTAVFSPARTVATNSGTLPVRIGLAGAMVGLLVGAAAAFARSSRTAIVSQGDEVAQLIGAPMLANIPDFAGEQIDSRLPVRDNPRSVAAEAFRFLAASLDARAPHLVNRSIVVVGIGVGGGQTTTTANMALAAASEGTRVLMLDADFGNQALSRMFDVDPLEVKGITDVVSGGLDLSVALNSIEVARGELDLISRGQVTVGAAGFFRSEEADTFLYRLRSESDLILIDTPPLLQVAYATTLAAKVGAAILVVPRGARVRDIEATAAHLRGIGTEILGFAFTRAAFEPRDRAVVGDIEHAAAGGDPGESVVQRRRA
jgi:Mrp family chromosome partitioning ATPase/capsular polysaccharide biosynthesis protein